MPIPILVWILGGTIAAVAAARGAKGARARPDVSSEGPTEVDMTPTGVVPVGPADTTKPKKGQPVNVAKDAAQADAAFGAMLGTVSTAVGIAFPVSLPYLGVAGVATGTAWKAIPPKAKSDIWQGGG